MQNILIFSFFTLTLVFQFWNSFCEKRTRYTWHSRNNSFLFKPFRPDTSEAAYQRFRLWSRVITVVCAFMWICIVLGWALCM